MTFLRYAAVGTLALFLSACGSGSNSNLPSTTGSCDPGTSVQLARPISGQTSVSSNQNPIEIVASNSGNTINTSTGNFNLLLQPQNGGSTISSSTLTPVSDNQGPHPYTNDFFYAGNVPTLQVGTTYTVLLNEPSFGCTPIAIGSFST